MTKKRLQLGGRGEGLACTYLKNLGYAILEKNFRSRLGELDIIAKDQETLVFIEVKTRSNTLYGSPLEAVNAKKTRQLIRVATEYMQSNGGQDQLARLDVISIVMHNDSYKIEHIKNAIDVNYF